MTTKVFDQYHGLIASAERAILEAFFSWTHRAEDLAAVHELTTLLNNGRVFSTERYYCVCCERHLRQYLREDLDLAGGAMGLPPTWYSELEKRGLYPPPDNEVVLAPHHGVGAGPVGTWWPRSGKIRSHAIFHCPDCGLERTEPLGEHFVMRCGRVRQSFLCQDYAERPPGCWFRCMLVLDGFVHVNRAEGCWLSATPYTTGRP